MKKNKKGKKKATAVLPDFGYVTKCEKPKPHKGEIFSFADRKGRMHGACRRHLKTIK